VGGKADWWHRPAAVAEAVQNKTNRRYLLSPSSKFYRFQTAFKWWVTTASVYHIRPEWLLAVGELPAAVALGILRSRGGTFNLVVEMPGSTHAAPRLVCRSA
jgi:hypothetical protein